MIFNSQLFHEELVLQWIVVHPSSRPLVLRNAWFFFEILVNISLRSKKQYFGSLSDFSCSIFSLSLSFSLLLFLIYMQIKAMAQHLNNSDKLNSQRRDRFSAKFMEDLDTLVGSIAMEICNKHVQVHTILLIIIHYHHLLKHDKFLEC